MLVEALFIGAYCHKECISYTPYFTCLTREASNEPLNIVKRHSLKKETRLNACQELFLELNS